MRKRHPLRAAFVDLWLAAVLLTRLPLPHLPRAAFDDGARAVWAYPLVGAFVGLVGAFAGKTALLLNLPAGAAAAITLGSMMLLTGAMHEDGLADLFDGFWGATTRERRLEIMRDSQIGTYGSLALLMVTLLRWSALAALLPHGIAPVVVAAALSRGMMPAVMSLLPRARSDGLAHSIGPPHAALAIGALGIGAFVGVLGLGSNIIIVVLTAATVPPVVGLLARQKIGGQTGDVLGAVQQLSESVVLLTCAALIL